ncbi:FecR family protein [Filimonas lacunae]|uniref:FecR family protein n=1 Tax=Filimonas lacunae TaxID=477680 RepID=A0A173MJD4_9BACT|nr:FecR family protein [Filimonas lacunae]BAV07753.1 anti-sigma factor [Filimonas lacunae]SIT04389.1 FecR family protein [Filimonas lacunae]
MDIYNEEDYQEYLCMRYFYCRSTEEELKAFFVIMKNGEGRGAMARFLEKEQLSGQLEARMRHADRIVIDSRRALGQQRVKPWMIDTGLATIAVALLLVIGIPLYNRLPARNQQQPVAEMVSRPDKEAPVTCIRLQDGSRLYLTQKSRYRPAPGFGITNRDITLYGEAVFDVAANARLPFKVHTGLLQTQVLGTVFKVQAYAHEPVRICVKEGKVQVAQQGQQPVLLQANQALSYQPLSGTIDRFQMAGGEAAAWMAHGIAFNQLPARDIAASLSMCFGVPIRVKSSVPAQESVSLYLQGTEQLNEVLGEFARTLEATYVIGKSEVVIQ